MAEPKSNQLFDQYLAGQEGAAAAIFDRYVARLLALARARISPKLNRRIDPEDVVQSAYRSFFVHASNQEYQLARSGDLWRLLAGTALNKLYGQIEKQTAAKRSIHREEVVEDAAPASLKAPEPTVAEVVAVGELLGLAIVGLSPDERLVLTATLQGQSVEEIAQAIGKSARTVRRLLAQARRQFEERLLGERVEPSKSAGGRARGVEPLAPLQFSEYVLEQLLGSGGMGKVYRATEKSSGKTVAVKALRKSRQTDERAVAQFVQESRILARLQHSNIVSVKGLGRFPGGGYFIVMDFVDGTDLQARLASGPLPVAEAVSILQDVAGAVQHAHDHGIVHCDLKPGNVLLDSDGHVYVTDFGFAFMLADVSPASVDSIGGTAGYIPPEILRLESQPTRAADIYALGVLLWTLATGQPPADGASLRAANKSVRPIESICRRCLADNPQDRYGSASELIDELSALPNLKTL